MTLDEWMCAKRISDAEFARMSGIGLRQLINRYRRKISFPSPESLAKIYDATQGDVTPNDFMFAWKHKAVSNEVTNTASLLRDDGASIFLSPENGEPT